MSQPLRRRNVPVRVGENKRGVRDEKRKPTLRGFKVYVGDFVDEDDPGNDPPKTSRSSPEWLNGFTYVEDSPVWFAHGLDGETDMGGAYDLVTGGPTNGDIAFMMPLEWATSAQPFAMFPALAEEGASPEDDIFIVCLQRVNRETGAVRIYWPIYAQAI